ncbi:MAG: ABC transporter permease [Muricauda sp.]|nr:ABC transporter permease [Allomuricauda sp.]
MLGLKAYLRHLSRNKMYTSVTILGFALSLTFVLLLGVYIQNELSVDDFHTNKSRIYRLENETVDFSAPIATDLKQEYAEIEDFTRVLNSSGRISKPDGQKVKFDFLGVDPGFFNMFSFPLLQGEVSDVLQTEDGVVLSKTMAQRLFGSMDAVGKSIFINTDHKFTVTGVMEDFPETTHFIKQDALVNLKAFKKLWGFGNIMEEYGFCSMSIYLMGKPNTDLPAKAPQILKNFNENFWLYQEGWASTVEFTPLKELYFSTKAGSGTQSSSKTLIMVLSVIVFIILLLAVGNYINLTIAQATFRGKEVAMKKLLGGSKKQLIRQLVMESMALCFVAVLLAFLLAKLLEPLLNSLLDTQLNLNQALNPINIMIGMGALLLVGLISGIVPAFKISNFKPIEVVRGDLRAKTKSVYAKAFITFQYTVAIALLACSWIILKQTDYLRNKDLGFNKDNVVHVEYLGNMNQKKDVRNELLKIPGVQEVSIMWQSPLSGGSNQTFNYNGKSLSFQEFAADSAFYSVFDIKVIPTDVAYTSNGVYLNQAAIKALELTDNPVSFKMDEQEVPILGVVNDFNFKQLRDNIGPLMIRQQTPGFFADNIFIKLDAKGALHTIEQIKTTYGAIVGDVEFDIQFVDDTIDQWYKKEERTGKIIGYFTFLAVIISSMGILAMATFYMQQRKKEIGVRKVNGATIAKVMALLNRDFVKWVALAFLIAVPISWYAMHQWLEGFAYKTSLNWWVFLFAGGLTMLVALLTVSWQSWRAASANPVDALRNE